MKQFFPFLFFVLISFALLGQKDKYPENFGGVFHSGKALLGKNIFKGDIGYMFSKISYRDTVNALHNYLRHGARISFNINPWRDLYLKTTFYIDFNRSHDSPPWLSNFYYQIGYYNWRSKTFSFGYENYQPNKWKVFFNTFPTNLKRGYFFVSYRYYFEKPSGRKQLRPIFWDETSRIILTPIIKIYPEYSDEFNNFSGYFKPVAGLDIRYVIVKNIYLETALFYYPIRKTILPWDPDFTYGFGVYDWRAFKLNFSYGNWIANRFPWNKKELDYYNFLNGEFILNFTYSW